MRRSPGLAAIRVLNHKGTRRGRDMPPPRPDGALLWVHATTRHRFTALAELCRRLLALRPDLHVLFTCPDDEALANWNRPTASMTVLPADTGTAVQAFLDHWRPDMCLWAGGDLRPTLLGRAAERRMVMVLLDVGEADLPLRRHRWLPDQVRRSLECFTTILANSDQAAQHIRRGVAPSRVSVSAALRISPNPVPWPEDELILAREALADRPVWLAAWLHPDEIPAVLAAHRSALRLLHRLVLVVHLSDPEIAAHLRQRLDTDNMRLSDWSAGEAIEDSTQVILCTDAEELGLWYRIAPLTFMGSSMIAGAGGRDPLTAVALGSAVLYGPNVGNHVDSYARLAAAGAARSIRDGETLGNGVVALLVPDRSAAMALAGWQVVTEGASLSDQLIELIQDNLDARP